VKEIRLPYGNILAKLYITGGIKMWIGRERILARREKGTQEDYSAEELYIALQPTRRKIIKKLKAEKPMYIEQIADSIGEDRKNVAFHLMTLQDLGLVIGEFGLIEAVQERSAAKGKAGKFFKLTGKGNLVADILEKLFKE